MVWTANIKQKGIQDKSFLVNVLYSNGALSFNDILDMTGGTIDTLSQKVQSRLDSLNATEALIPQVTVGAFTPVTSALTALQTFLKALQHFQSCQRAVAVGLMQAGNSVYTDAQAAVIAAYDPSFIDMV